MKPFPFVVFLISAISFANNSNAQVKAAYININNLIAIMPETALIDSLLDVYEVDSLKPVYMRTMTELEAKMKIVNDTLRTPLATRQQAEQEANQLFYTVKNWQRFVEIARKDQRSLLIEPIYTKAANTVKQIAIEKGYTHIFNKANCIIAPDADDLIILAAAKLNIALPKNMPIGIKIQ